jgi:threonine dehydratase
LSAKLNNQIYLKREDQQPVHSFKLRGAYNKLNTLSEEQCIHGVMAASAGNHAQGLALAAKKNGHSGYHRYAYHHT